VPQPVFLIQALLGERYFWAYWSCEQDFKLGLAPCTYCLELCSLENLYGTLKSQYPVATELQLPEHEKIALYRRVRRAELPHQVREQIYVAIQARRQAWQQHLYQFGFDVDDLLNTQALKQRYRQLLLRYHPDHGGDVQDFLSLQRVYQQAAQQIQASRTR